MKRILFYGDSNTYGYDPRLGFEDRYPEEIRWVDRLKKEVAGWKILANGMNGRELPAFPEEYLRVERLIRQAQEEAPLDVFAVMLGTNEVLGAMGPVPSELVALRLQRFLEALRRAFPDLPLLVIAPPPVGSEDTPDPDLQFFYGESLRMNRRFWEAAGEVGADFLDAADWNLPMAYDGVHLAEQGHILFAEHLKAWLQRQS